MNSKTNHENTLCREQDIRYMNHAISLAKLGLGWTNPNPIVGAVIVKEGRIIGEGYHARYGELHAERNAIHSLTESAQGATMYVTLEPCCHYGKTPPCTEAILQQGIRRVVIGSGDPNPNVAGKGAALLKEAGVIVEEGLMREECDRLNPVFFHYITTGMPYVVMKYAMTLDGKIATHTGASKWITGEKARNQVQEMRHQYMGILAGIGTVLKDDPMLNVRLEGKKSPVRIICDSRLRIPLDSQICQTARQYPTLVACGEGSQKAAAKLEEAGIEIISVPDSQGRVDLKRLMAELGRRKIDSVLIEGGGELNESALRAGIVQELKVFVAPKLFGGSAAFSPVTGPGISLPHDAWNAALEKVSTIGEDLLLEYKVNTF